MNVPGIIHTAFFRWERLTRRDQRLERVRVEPSLVDHPWANGVDVEVRLEIASSRGGLVVTRVDVRTTPEDIVTPYGTIPAPPVEPRAVTTDLMRLAPLGALEREALEHLHSDDAYAEARDVLPDLTNTRTSTTERPRRGRPPKLTPELLAVVARAHATGGRRSVQAVQDALDAAGYEGNGPDGTTTWDQAAKAVAKARQEGLLPPAGS